MPKRPLRLVLAAVGGRFKLKRVLTARCMALLIAVSCLLTAAGTPRSFEVHLRSLQDVALNEEPSWWTRERILSLTVFMSMASLGILGWVVILRRQARSQTALIQTALEATADGILVLDEHERIVNYNHKFIEMWRIPQQFLALRETEQALEYVQSQLKDPEAFMER